MLLSSKSDLISDQESASDVSQITFKIKASVRSVRCKSQSIFLTSLYGSSDVFGFVDVTPHKCRRIWRYTAFTGLAMVSLRTIHSMFLKESPRGTGRFVWSCGRQAPKNASSTLACWGQWGWLLLLHLLNIPITHSSIRSLTLPGHKIESTNMSPMIDANAETDFSDKLPCPEPMPPMYYTSKSLIALLVSSLNTLSWWNQDNITNKYRLKVL